MTVTGPELLFFPSEERLPPSNVGGKARGLIAIGAAGLFTAPWFAVPVAAQEQGEPSIVEPDLADEIRRACDHLTARGAHGFAVRSSALDEDSDRQSFAGQYATVLNAPDADAVLAAVRACWASDSRAEAYRVGHKLTGKPRGVAVIVQAMVPAAVSGVAFSVAPDSADDLVVVATRGLGQPLVSGEVDGDEYRVARDGSVEVRRVDRRPSRVDSAPGGGLETTTIVDTATERCLSDRQVLEVADAARLLEASVGAPQDVEWAYALDGTLFILQTRPITTHRGSGYRGQVRLWDNANIVESFPNLTTPLTFSVAREAYAAVYRQVCLAIGVSESTVREHDDVFGQMIGLIHGRVYYNLTTWYVVLSLLPGFRHSQTFMERMMGTARPGARQDENSLVVAPRRQRLAESAATAVRLTGRFVGFERDVHEFQRSIDAVRRDFAARDLSSMSADELLEQYEELRRGALSCWRTPIINDLFLMIFHGLLRRVADRWLGPQADELVNALLRTGGLPSAEPARALAEIAGGIRADGQWRAALERSEADFGAVLEWDPDMAPVKAMVEAYLERWGDRCPEELQLDRLTYRDDPLALWAVIRALVLAPPRADDRVDSEAASLQTTRQKLTAGRAWIGVGRRVLFGFLLRQTQRHVQWREEMRFARGQVFGIGRRIFDALGLRLTEAGLLSEPADVHYLDIDELRGAIHGTGVVVGVRTLVAERRATYQAWRNLPPPPHRFQTRGPVILAAPREERGGPGAVEGQEALRGIGASPGRVRQRCVVVDDPREAPPIAGRIVVARSTDPGWVPIFLAAGGLLVERGSLLSHSAIVARELGLPTIVGIPGLATAVKAGQVLEMDGATGEVWLIPQESDVD